MHHRAPVAQGKRLYQAKNIAAVHAAEHGAHRGFGQGARAKGNRLVGQAQRVAHRAARRTRQQAKRLGIRVHRLLAQHLHQMLANRLGRHGPQVELQAARQHGHRHFLRIGGSEHKFEVVRRLFQRLQHGVERRVGQHVHLVDHEDFEAPLHRLVHRLLQQRLHLVHAAVGRSVKLGVIHKAA